MTYQETIKALEDLKNERGVKYYQKTYGNSSNYLGLGLTPLRKLAKKIKIDKDLSKHLSKSKYFEAKMLAMMIDDPRDYNQNKLEAYLKKLPIKFHQDPLSYFTMMLTEYIVSKSPDVEKVIEKLSQSDKSYERFIAYSSLANLGRLNKNNTSYFEKFINTIESNIQNEENNVKDAMNNCMLYWGQKNIELNSKILKSFNKVGKITVDYGDTSCQTPDVPNILSSQRIQRKISK